MKLCWAVFLVALGRKVGSVLEGENVLPVVLHADATMACLGGAAVPRGQRVLGPDEGLAGEYDDQQGEGLAEELHIESLRLLAG